MLADCIRLAQTNNEALEALLQKFAPLIKKCGRQLHIEDGNEEMIGMCDQKEREFMEELYRKYERLMYATVRRYISDSMEQEEIVQESLKKLIEKRRVLCNLDCAAQAGYIVVAIRNTSFSYLRKRNRERSKIISLETLNEEGMRHIILAEEEQLFYEEEIEKLKEGLKHLGPEDRALLEGKYLLKYGDKELVRDFGCQPNSIRMKLTRARRKLMVIMKRSKVGFQAPAVNKGTIDI